MDLLNENEIIGLYDDFFKDETYFCSAFDKLFNLNKYKQATNDDIKSLQQYLTKEELIEDDKFVNQLLFIFCNGFNVEIIRMLSHSTKYFDNDINIFVAFNKLKDLYEKLISKQHDDKESTQHNNDNIISFLKFMLFEPIEFLRSEKKELESLGFYHNEDLLESFKRFAKIEIHNGKTPCVLSFICPNSSVIHELFTNKYKDVIIPQYIPDIDVNGDDYFNNVITFIYQNSTE